MSDLGNLLWKIGLGFKNLSEFKALKENYDSKENKEQR